MAIRKYTRDELLHLKDSPLVTKPDNLPAIEQWLEYVYVDRDSREKLRIPHSEAQQQQTQNATQNKRQPQRGEASPMGNFGAGARPSLLSTRSHGGSRTGGESGLVYPDFGTGLMRARAEDVSLGPPKTVFASSRNVNKLGEGGDRNGDGEEAEGPRSRFFGDKSNRKSLNEKADVNHRDWTRRGMGADDDKGDSRWGRRDKDADGEKRNGHGDRQWGERRQNGEKQGGWRDREREKRDPEWSKPEREPEWMDDPAPPNAEDDLRSMGMPRNQEQFQKWKEAMSGKKNQAEAPAPEPEPAPVLKDKPAQKANAAPLKLEGISDKPFGGWAESKPSITTPDGMPAPAKTATAKGKGSRFASMFKESQPKDEPPPPPPAPETGVQKVANAMATGAAEDEAGFKRILQMLGNTNVSQPAATVPDGPSSPQPKPNTNGSMKQKSRFTGFFDQSAGPKSPERIQSPPEQVAPRHLEDMFSSSRGMPPDAGGMFGGAPSEGRNNEQARSQAPHGVTSPEPPPGLAGNNQRPQSGRMNDLFVDQPPSRGAATPDINIQNLLAAQRNQRPQGQQDKNSEFLLNLLQTKGSSRPPSQQARPENFSLWLDQSQNMPEPHAPKPRVPPPPGLFEDQLLRNAPPEHQRQEPHQQMHGSDIPQRRQSQRAAPGMPPGFYDEQSMYMQQQQQRRQFGDPSQQHPPQQQPGRRISGHPNLPQMQIPPPGMPQQQQPFGAGHNGPPPPEFLQSPTGGPPPGFNPHMARHPPGLGNVPNIFQQPQQQQGRNAADVPPGFGGTLNAGMQSPPGMPPGFYGVPPGFQGMRPGGEGMAVGAGGRGRGFEGGYEGMGGRR